MSFAVLDNEFIVGFIGVDEKKVVGTDRFRVERRKKSVREINSPSEDSLF